MREQMNISVNGQSRVPPGFRFHPTEEELLQYYLRKKVANEKIDLDVICEVDLNKLEPWDIQEKCKIGTTPQNDWYFFSHKDKKYPTGTRTNRATVAGFWKATGRDKVIYSHGKRIGMRKTLVFYKGRAPHGQKSDWIMHEYRLDENPPYDTLVHISGTTSFGGDLTQEEGWVVCRIFKKNHPKATIGRAITTTSSTTTGTHTCALDSPTSDDVDPVDPIDYETTGSLDQIFQYMGPTKYQHHHNPTAEIDPMISTMMVNPKGNNLVHHAFMKLPTLESPIHTSNNPDIFTSNQNDTVQITSSGLSDWASLDRLVASQLNGQVTDGFKQLSSAVNYTDATMGSIFSMVDHDIDNLWSFTRSSSSSILPTDPLCHVSDAGM